MRAFIADTSKRIKAAVDSRIAEEQARAKASGSPIGRTNSTASRSSRNESPASRAGRKTVDVSNEPRGPDPSEFESAFVIDDEEPSQVGTPVPPSDETSPGKEGQNAISDSEKTTNSTENTGEKPAEGPKAPASTELPLEVRQKLRKLEKLESRYQGNCDC